MTVAQPVLAGSPPEKKKRRKKNEKQKKTKKKKRKRKKDIERDRGSPNGKGQYAMPQFVLVFIDFITKTFEYG